MAARKKVSSRPRFALHHVLLCEEVRPELGGKMTLIGYYGSDTIIVGSEPAMLRGLAFIFGLDQLQGNAPSAATFRLERTDGGLLSPELTIPLIQSTQTRKNVIVQTNGLEVRDGEYKASLTIEGEKLTTTFAIRSDADFISRLNAARYITPTS